MNRAKGNHKHLTLSQRIEIEKGLLSSRSFAEIARIIGKDPTTISKEVRKHSEIRQRKDTFAPVPCQNRSECKVRWLCLRDCGILCKLCREPGRKCIDLCDNYVPTQCEKLLKAPYVCNGCGKRINCLMDKKIYSAKYADDRYRDNLVSCREGINQTPAGILELDSLISPLILKGQSIAHIYNNHSQEIKCSRRTLYTYISKSVFTARNLDLRRKVRYRPRKKSTQSSIINREFRKGRGYDDFQKLLKDDPSLPVVEMDLVEGRKGGNVLLTMLFKNCSLMIAFLLESKTQENVQRIFDELTNQLGIEVFQSLFPVILTDNGVEFQNSFSLENTEAGERRTNLYYCNPHSSWQKGSIEKKMINHINSEARDSLNGCTPFKLSLLLLNNQLHQILSLQEIAPDEVIIKPNLIK